jgi:alcohol dehydrogenase class IV
VSGPSFGFATAGEVRFGCGVAQQVPELVASLGSRALVCTGRDPARVQGLISAFTVPVTVFRVPGEPTVELATEAVELARQVGADVVVGLGGGSTLDLAKAVAALLTNAGEPLDYLEVIGRGRRLLAPSVPLIAVPTTAGTGAEVTANAVLASPGHRVKVSLRSAGMLPRVAVVDPELTLACPPDVTASSGLDALTQCIEPLVSGFATPITDGFATEGLRRASTGLVRAYLDGADLAARTDLALCSLLGGMALANAKLGAVHGLAGVLGGTTRAAHGAICAALLAPVTAANVRALRSRDPANPALERYAEVARLLTGRVDARIDDGLEWIRATTARLGLPGPAALGLAGPDADDVVTTAMASSSMRGNPVTLTRDELHAVLAAA